MSRLKEIGGLNYDQYVELMTMMLSDDRAAIAEANRLLFVLLVTGKDARRIPAVALHELSLIHI